jgi:hypothetical protein
MHKARFVLATAAAVALVAATATTSLATNGKLASNSGGTKVHGTSHFSRGHVDIAGFTSYARPKAAYTSNTCDIDISAIPDFTDESSVTGCGSTVTFSSAMNKRSVPNSWASWGSPPNTETDTPNLFFSQGAVTATLNFDHRIRRGGIEVEPDLFQVEHVNVKFYGGLNGTGRLVGSITRSCNGSFGAKLFAGKVLAGTSGWKSLVISNDSGDDFGFAQIRL